jgi:hypothetical protein
VGTPARRRSKPARSQGRPAQTITTDVTEIQQMVDRF